MPDFAGRMSGRDSMTEGINPHALSSLRLSNAGCRIKKCCIVGGVLIGPAIASLLRKSGNPRYLEDACGMTEGPRPCNSKVVRSGIIGKLRNWRTDDLGAWRMGRTNAKCGPKL